MGLGPNQAQTVEKAKGMDVFQGELSREVEFLGKIVDHLNVRLEPVMIPVRPSNDGQGSIFPTAESPAFGHALNQIETLKILTMRIHDMIERLDL